ncbi:MAG: FliG C-terminal domain-containing protein [Pseudomonadota bacterium]
MTLQLEAPSGGELAPSQSYAIDLPPLTKPQKAAIIINALGEELAQVILPELGSSAIRAFARSSARLGDVPKVVIGEVVGEFVEELSARGISINHDVLRRLLSEFMSPQDIDALLRNLDVAGGAETVWQRLNGAKISHIVAYLSREHSQTTAVVLTNLAPEKSARVLAKLDPMYAQEVLMRMAHLETLKPQVIDMIEKSVQSQLLDNDDADGNQGRPKPAELIGSMMNFMARDKRDGFLSAMEEKMPDFANAVQKKMFTFEDIPKRLLPTSVANVCRAVEAPVLLSALFAAKQQRSAAFDFILNNISKRLAEQYRESIDEMSAPTQREMEEAQQELVGAIRKMADSGEIKLVIAEDDEEDDEE